jgi:hypothetical protein
VDKEDVLESEEFYLLMQAYRHMPVGLCKEVGKAYEDVKAFIRENFTPKERSGK